MRQTSTKEEAYNIPEVAGAHPKSYLHRILIGGEVPAEQGQHSSASASLKKPNSMYRKPTRAVELIPRADVRGIISRDEATSTDWTKLSWTNLLKGKKILKT